MITGVVRKWLGQLSFRVIFNGTYAFFGLMAAALYAIGVAGLGLGFNELVTSVSFICMTLIYAGILILGNLLRSWLNKTIPESLSIIRRVTRTMEMTGYTPELIVPLAHQKEMDDLIEGYNRYAHLLHQRKTSIHTTKALVEEKTRDLSIALDRAQASDRSKSAFIGLMSHELKQPLFSATFALLNMQRHPAFLNNPDLADYGVRISDGLRRATEHVDEVLELSRNAQGIYDRDVKEFDLYREMEAAFVSMAAGTYEKGLSFDLIVDPFIPPVVESCSRSIHYILRSLISNAIKFTHEGGVVVRVFVDQVISANEMVIGFSVSDTGIGIPEDKMASIFEPFSQIDSNLNRQYSGHGIGLNIASNRLATLNGAMTVESGPGGSTFTARIPMTRTRHILGAEQRMANSLLKDMNAVFAIVNTDTPFRNGMYSRLSLLGAECFECSSIDDLKVVADQYSGKNLVVIIQRANATEERNASATVRQINTIKPKMFISLEYSCDNLEKYKQMVDGDIDQIMNAHVSCTTLLKRVRNFIKPKQNRLHDIFLEQSQLMEGQTLSGVRILLVDDDKTNLDYTAEYLSSFGAKVDTALGAEQGIYSGQNCAYDVIFLDIMMPRINGIQVGYHIRDVGLNRNTPIFAFTAANLSEKERLELEMMKMTLLSKTEAGDTLVVSVRTAMAKQSTRKNGEAARQLSLVSTRN